MKKPFSIISKAKNTYWFSCWGELSYYQEEYEVAGVIRDNYVNLVPSGYEPFHVGGGNFVTTNADLFWEASLLDARPETDMDVKKED